MEFISREAIDYGVEGHSLEEILNINEQSVLNAMRKVLRADASLCRCSLCIEDIFALALNSLPPRYIQATSGKAYETGPHYIGEDDIRAKVLTAVEKVRENPNH